MFTPRHRFLLFLLGSGLIASAHAQSTLATLRGTVHDTTGALVPNATVVVHRVESNTDRSFTSGDDGQYTAVNLEPGTYELRIQAKGFRNETDTNLLLAARQQLVFDVTLQVPNGDESVTVNAAEAGTINTADASISAALSTQAVQDLPANYRGAGSTSPLNVIQTLPGVQPDSGGYPPQPSAAPNPAIKFSIQGGLPSQSETTVDGISAQNQTSNNILGDAFPSAEAIAEIRVDGVNNNAEYGQPGEITTVTKAGTNHLHGSVYEYFQNSGFDAIPFGYTQASKAKKVANDFGASLAGPLVIPHLYNGRDRTFFFADYEGLRYATARGVQYVVPTALMRMGDFSQESAARGANITNPFTRQPYPNNKLTPNPSSAALLGLFPLPNRLAGEAVANVLNEAIPFNYVSTKRNDINSDQYDIRVDQTIGSRGTAFVRYTNKTINQVLPEDLALPNGSSFATYRILAASFAYAITPRLANEARFGFTLEQDGQSNNFNGQAFTSAANFTGLPGAFFNGVPHLGFQQISSGGLRLNASERSRLFQYVDNLTYSRGNHTLRFGGDLRSLNAFTPLSFTPSDNYGNFYFQQNGTYSGNEFADFLAGVPNVTQVANVQNDNNGSARAYAVYVEDNWKATPRLTLTFGLRYELHPAFSSTNGQIGNFDPSVAKSGRLIYPAGYANLLSVPELAGFNACPTTGVNNPNANGAAANGAPCTPVVSNTQANLPAGLRTTPRQRAEPRLGFVLRPFNSEKTAIRGGAGYFNITTSGALFYALTGSLQSNLQTYQNDSTTSPSYSFPNLPTNAIVPTFGTGSFNAAVDTNWHDPYSLQTNLSVDQDLGHNFSLRVSYIGLQTWHLVWQPELNQLPASTTTVAAAQPRSAFPFPNFQAIFDRATSATANYHSGQVELNRRFSHGFSFSAGYTFAKSLADNQGTYGTATGQSSFVDEQGGYDSTSNTNRHLDYGNVVGTRRHRLITSSVYELPYGHGRRFGATNSRALDLIAGGWQVSGIFGIQSGPALTAYIPSGNTDSSGTGSGTLYFRQQRPDRVAGGNYAGRSRNAWFNPNAFACPGGKGIDQTTGATLTGFASLQNGACVVGGYSNVNNTGAVPVAPIGRYGTESIGDLTGPGLVSLSTGLSKTFRVTEAVHFRLEGTFSNVLNHTNLGDPILDVTNPAFGAISSARGSDFGGNRTGQVSARVEF